MTSTFQQIEDETGIQLPRFLYGTAWKEARTQSLTKQALVVGFRGIDTANQRKHYDEASVGLAVQDAISAGILARGDLFLQTKFTFQRGQDHRLPYDPRAAIGDQVQQSFASSVEHLGTEIIDAYVLHGPTRRIGLATEDWSAWRSMESLHADGRVRLLGISNVSLEQLQTLCRSAKARPRFVQNRCYADQFWDREIRDFCRANGIIYQGFSLLTANREALTHPRILRIAEAHGRSAAQIVFRFAIDVGMLPLTGTSSMDHMQADLDVDQFQLTPDEVRQIEEIAAA
jgi:diketogulonate reductase-like aldo/keto reductase